MNRPLIAACCAVLAAACGDKVCTMEYTPSLAVSVLDSISGTHVEKGASLLIRYQRNGTAQVDSMQGTADAQLLWGGHVGQMDLTVRRDGYVPWAQSVFVPGYGSCNKPKGVVQVLAKLQRAG